MDLGRVKEREKLKPKGNAEPHWQRVKPGCFIGYVPAAGGGAGSWVARAYDEDRRRYRRKSLGPLSDVSGNERYAIAKNAAEQFAHLVETGGHTETKIETVADACAQYAGGKPDLLGRFKRHVFPHPIAKVKLDKLRKRHLRDWRKWLEEKPALVSRRKSGPPRTRDRSQSSLNRDMAAMRAALNKVLAQGKPGTEADWQEALKPVPDADGKRDLYLTRDQRGELLAAVDSEALPFVRALCLLPLRPGAMAKLSAGDYKKHNCELKIGQDKNGKRRSIIIPKQAAELFSLQAADKLPGAPLFMRGNGTRWNKDSWKIPINRAASAAGLPATTCAYTLRHSTITDLVKAGLPLLTIAQISGTSVEMIEKHYGHLVCDAALAALETLSL